MQDILTAGMLEPYVTDPDNYGGVLFTPQRLSSFMQELDGHGIDLHLHAAGDRATRNILDTVEQARGALGRPLGIEVTLSHLFSVADSDIERLSRVERTRQFHATLVRRNGVRERQTDQRRSGNEPAALSSSGILCGDRPVLRSPATSCTTRGG